MRQVRTIDKDGKQVGVIATEEALKMAEQSNLDLVEVAPDANPPVCRIMDFGKYRYEQTKREREAKKKQHFMKVKEIKVRPTIEEHDYHTKFKQAQDFLSRGDKVKVVLIYKGREMAHMELGQRVLDKFVKDLEPVGAIESRPKLFGRMMVMVIAPLKTK